MSLNVTSITRALVKLHNFSAGSRAEGVFYRSLLDQVGVYEDDSKEKELAWCEGASKVCVNPKLFEKLSLDEQVGVLAHEARHIYQGTARRAEAIGADPKIYNVASDLVINEALLSGGFTLPDGGASLEMLRNVCPEAYQELRRTFKVHETTEEQVYGTLKKYLKEPPKNYQPDAKPGNKDGDNKEEAALKESSVKVKVAAALMAAQKAGDLPGHLASEIEEVLKEHTPWPRKVREWMQSFSDSDLSWTRPDRGVLSNFTLIMPDFWSESMGELVVAIDTSGSMSQEMLDNIAGHLSAGLAEVKPEKLHVIYCDTTVQHVDTYDNPQHVKLTRHGGGGTCFCPPFDYVAEKNIKPAGLIYFTDGYGSFPEEPAYPVLWCVVEGGISEVPFGKYVAVDLEG